MKAVCEALGVARSNIAARARAPLGKPRQGRPALPDGEIVMAIQAIVTEMPSYGYRRVWALLRRVSRAEGRPAPNHKRVYRVMKAHGLLLQRKRVLEAALLRRRSSVFLPTNATA